MQTHSASDSVTRSETFIFAAALDAYEVTCSRLVTNWLDMNMYVEAGTSIATIRERGVSNPALTVLALQLAIAHAELEAALWQKGCVGMPDAKLTEVRERHASAVQLLRTAALALLRSD